MLERVAAWFLNTYIAEYVGNLNTDQLSIGLLSGAVELEKLTLKKDALRKLKLPVEVKAGYIGKLRLQVPVRYMKSQPWVVQVDQLYIIASPPDISNFDPDEERALAQSRKLMKLASMEQKWREEQQSGKSSWFWSSFANSFTSTVAENLQVIINDIHIRYEDQEVGGAHPLVIGLIIKEVSAQSTNENWEPQFSGVGTDKTHKLVDVKDLTIYWDKELFGDLQTPDLVDAMLHKSSSVVSTSNMMSSSMFAGHALSMQHLIRPFSATAQITRNCSIQPLRISDGPRVNVNVRIVEVPIVLSENQFAQFVKLSEAFQMRMKAQKYRELRPVSSVTQSPKLWWKFAMKCVTRNIREQNERLTLTFVLCRARQCVSYVSAYTTHLTNTSVTEEVESVLQDTEKELNYEELVILRRVAMQRVERERALAEEARRVATAEVQQQGVIQRWFPGWISGYTATTSGVEGGGGGTLEEVDEEELLDELGLEMDANSKLLRDRIFAVVSFHLEKGTLELVTDDNCDSVLGPNTLLELELSHLSCHIDYRPRLRYSCYEIQLGGITVSDHYQEDSIFQTLVKPKDKKSPSHNHSFHRQHSIKFSRTQSCGDLFQLQLTQQDRHPNTRGYNLHVVTRPLDVIYNMETMIRLKEFFTVVSPQMSSASENAGRVGGVTDGLNHTLLDFLTVKLDISAPHIIIPESFTDSTTPMIIIDLGHLDFESVSDLLEDVINQDEDIFFDIDEDEEFVTPPSSPPSETEYEELSRPVPSTILQTALQNTVQERDNIHEKSTKNNKYLLQLSDIQILVGKLHGISESTLHDNENQFHLLNRFNLVVKIQRNANATFDVPHLSVMANLPLLHFHIDENKVHTLISCLMPPKDTHSSETLLDDSDNTPISFAESIIPNSQTTASIYQSAINFFDQSRDSHVTKKKPNNVETFQKHSSVEMSHVKLIQAQMCIEELLLDISSSNHCIAELKVLGVKGGIKKRPHDLSLRVIIEDLFLVDRMQGHGPQYELILCSSGRHLFSKSPTEERHSKEIHEGEDLVKEFEDIFATEIPFLLNVTFNHLSSLSPDYPVSLMRSNENVGVSLQKGPDVRNLSVQCTAIDALANQETIIEFIRFCQKAVPTDIINTKHGVVHDGMEPNPVTIATPIQTSISIEFEKFGLTMLRGRYPGSIIGDSGVVPSLLTTSIELHGLGVEAKFADLIKIEGFLEGAKVTDLTPEGKKYHNIVSVGACREGRDLDMITTVITSSDSLRRLSDCLSFSITRSPQTSSTNFGNILYDVQLSIRIPSILYTHSVNFIKEMELFGSQFKHYFSAVTNSMKSAAIDMAKGLVTDKSHIVEGLHKLSTSLGGSLLPQTTILEEVEEEEEEEEVDFINLGGVDRVLFDIHVDTPIVIIPSSMTSNETIVAHLGNISLKNEFVNMSDDRSTEPCDGFVLSSHEVDRMIFRISNMSLHSSHDQASLDWLVSEIQDDVSNVCGRWYKILKEISFELRVERVIGTSLTGQTTLKSEGTDEEIDEDEVEMMDVRITCSLSNSLLISLPKAVFDQIKCTIKNGIYVPLSSSPMPSYETPGSFISTGPDVDEKPFENLPRIFGSFSLPRLSIEFSHLIGDEEKKIVFVSLEDFFVHCHKTRLHHFYLDLALKTIVIEDLLQTQDSFRYILSSTSKPIYFPSPVSTPTSSLFTCGMGISPRHFFPLTHVISSPKPTRSTFSPLRTFNPLSNTSTPVNEESGSFTEATSPPWEASRSSITDLQDLVSIRVHVVSKSSPEFVSKFASTSTHIDVAFSSVFLVINLQTWVLFFDYLGIGVPTPPSSPMATSPTFFQSDQSEVTDDNLEFYSLRTDGSVYIKKNDNTETGVTSSVPMATSPGKDKPLRSTVWGIEGKISAHVNLQVQAVSVTFNKPEHPLARGVASELNAEANLNNGNVRLKGSLGQATLIDLTETGSYYRERFTTTGDQALTFDIFKFGQRDPHLERPYDISASVQLSAVKYLHTMRFLKEVLAFCTHFPQLIDAFQRMKAVSRGNLNYTPDRKPRILLEVEADEPMILIPKHAFSPEIMGGVIKKLTLCNKFLYDGDKGTLSQIRGRGQYSHYETIIDSIPRRNSTPSDLSKLYNDNSARSPSNAFREKSSFIPQRTNSFNKTTPTSSSKVSEDRKIEDILASHGGPCLLDCMELVLSDVDVFSARKTPVSPGGSKQDGYLFHFKRDDGKVLKEKGTLKLLIERNLYEDFCRNVPDIHIDGTLSALNLMLDKRQLEIIKGLIDMNLGEQIDEFEKPSTVIHDPIAQPVVAAVWTGFRFHIEFIGVQLEFLRSRPTPTISLTQSLALFDIQLSEFTFESHSDQSKTVDFTTHAVIGHDTRYEGGNKQNVYKEVLKSRYTVNESLSTKSLQVEIHVILSPTHIKASILLNRLRLIGILDLLVELKRFVIDKLPEEMFEKDERERNDCDSSIEEVDGSVVGLEALSSLRQSIVTRLQTPQTKKEENKPDRDVKVSLSVTETDLVVVEDLTSVASNAVVLKGTVVLNFHSPPKIKGSSTLRCSIDGLELFSCVVSHEDDTALSILDPVSIGIELKPLDLNKEKVTGTHTLEFDIRQLNVRVSYNDIKLFITIIQSLQLSSLQDDSNKPKRHTHIVNEKLVKQLLPLGFPRSAILHELNQSGGDINMAALRLTEEEVKGREIENGMKLNSIEVIIGTINLCLIDDSLNHDIPLIELTLGSLHADQQLITGLTGNCSSVLALDYYNRSISAWEPIIEPWRVQFKWQKMSQFSTDLDTNEKPDRLSLSVISPEQLCVNVTSSLLHLFQETQASWQSDLKEATHEQKEKQLLYLHHHTTSRGQNETNGAILGQSSDTPVTNVQQGLALLHSVRFISQSRQRTKFIPFALRNSTGLPLSFVTLTSLPSEVLFNPSNLLESSKRGTVNVGLGLATNPVWIHVDYLEEKPFDFLTHQKMRHKDTRALIVHQLRVKIDGWEEITVPISVDKIGIFFRDIRLSTGSGHEPVRLVFAISLSDTRKVVNVRSGLVVHNTLELPMEVKLDPPTDIKASSISLPVIKPVSYYAIPLHLTHWDIRVRPQGWGLKFCTLPLTWAQNAPTNLRECKTIGDTINHSFRFCVQVKQESFPSFTLSPLTPSPGHTLIIHPPVIIGNLLPFDFHFCYTNREKLLPHGKMVPIHTLNPLHSVKFSVTKLEGFSSSEECTVSVEDVGVVRNLVVMDTRGRKLYLSVSTELIGRVSLKILIWCQYWIVNRTGIPLVFCAEGNGRGETAAGQYEEYETASTATPLLFSYSDRDLVQKCQVRLGREHEEGLPSWSSGFRMLRKSEVIRLFVKRGDGRPDREYQIGMEIHRGSDQYRTTRVVTFVARFQLENGTSFKLTYVQRHLLLLEDSSISTTIKESSVIMPSALMAFHWPRTDLDQLLCIRVMDLQDCHWSGGFSLEQDKSFHINMRQSYGRSVFIRCEVLQRGETYHVIFSDASNYPPPFKLENLSQVPIICYQSGVSQSHLYILLNPGQSIPYAWDETTLTEKLCVQLKTGSESRQFDLGAFGSQGKVYYESYFYIVATETNDQSSLSENQKSLVLDVPQGKAVILTRKSLGKRTQLWRMTSEGNLVHVVSSSHSTNYVLDLLEPVSKGRYHDNKHIPLLISRMSSKKVSTQTWEFTLDGHLVLKDYPFLCVQCRHGYESVMEGADAVLGRIGTGGMEEFRRLKQSPGSGVLSVAVVPDGPTRILRITDENKKYTYSSIQDDWVIVEHGIVGPAKVTDVDPISERYDEDEEEEGIKMELALSLSLEKGVGVSLINSVPEELIFVSASGIRIEYVSTAVHHCLNATIQYIQIDNQITGSYSPVLAFPSPPSSGEMECNYPVISCFIERLPHQSPFVIVIRTFDIRLREFTLLLEEKLLFKLLQWAGIGVGGAGRDSAQEEMMARTMYWSPTSSSLPSHQLYIEQLRVSATVLLVSMHTTSQLPEDLLSIKRHFGFPLIQFESPIILEGFQKTHMLGTPVLFVDTIGKHYKKVIEGQAVKILGSVDFLGNPVGLISDVASGVQGMISLDVVGLVRDVTHGMSDTTSKLTGTVSHVLGQATGDSSFQVEREQNLESCQSSGDHFKAGLINLTGGIFGGMSSIITQPYKGAVEEGIGGFIWGIGKGVVGTVAKPVAGLLDFASGTTAALRESMSRMNRHIPGPVRLRRCCVGATGALNCYTLQLARGQEYLMRLNDGDNCEKLVSYEKINTGSEEIRVIISSQALYFFQESPPDRSSLDNLVKLDELVECRATKAKTTIPITYLVLSVLEREDQHEGKYIRPKKFKCSNEQNARKIAQLINYAKNLHEEEKMIIRTPRLQHETLW